MQLFSCYRHYTVCPPKPVLEASESGAWPILSDFWKARKRVLCKSLGTLSSVRKRLGQIRKDPTFPISARSSFSKFRSILKRCLGEYHSFRNHYMLNSKTIKSCNYNCRKFLRILRGILSCDCVPLENQGNCNCNAN